MSQEQRPRATKGFNPYDLGISHSLTFGCVFASGGVRFNGEDCSSERRGCLQAAS